MTRQLGIPEFLNGNADEDEKERDADDPEDNESANDIGPSLEKGETKDAVVHHQKTKFRPDQVDYVEDLSGDEELGHQNDVFGRNFVSVKTHPTSNHPEYESDDNEIPSLVLGHFY